MKTCSRCNIKKSLKGFNKDRTHNDGHGSWCKECCSKRNKGEHIREYNRNYNRSPRGQKVRKKYAKSKKGHIVLKKALQKYRRSEKYVKYRISYRKLPKVKEGITTSRLKSMYGITLDLYRTMFSKQNGRCAICRKSEIQKIRGKIKALSVDHCHKTGKVRGLLCDSCNNGLGRFKDSLKLLALAMEYLKSAT